MAKKIVTQWSPIVEAVVQRGEKIWVGVDVHTKKHAVAVLTESGIRHSFVTSADPEGLIRQFTERGLQPEVLVYEAGLTGFGLYRAGLAAGIKVMVVSANRIPRPVCQTAKTDLLDCRRLAELAAKNELKGIYVPSEEEEARRALARRRVDLSRGLARIKVKIKSFLTCHGLPLPAAWGRKEMAELAGLSEGLRPGLGESLSSLLRESEYLRLEKAEVARQVKELMVPKERDVLQSVPGVGPITSSTFRAEVIDPKRFENGEQLASFLGLAPTVRQSGESRGQAHLAPSGQGALRSLLVEAAWVFRKEASWASELYDRLHRRTGSFQKAITALTRKLAVILWRLWLEDREYEPQYQSPGLVRA
jgi:transposase